jgi:long-chain acyl-CoA synthetase
VLLLYTAAFDGRPNGALLSQTSLLVQGLYGILYGGAGPDDVYLNAGPLFHVGTLKATLATLLAGGSNVFVRRVDPAELCRLIDEERCTGAFLQPPTVDAMVEVNRDGAYDLTCLRAKPGSDAWNAMVAVDGAAQRYRSGFGQTELGGVVTFVDRDRPCSGSAGRPAPLARVEVLAPDGRPAAPGDTGELVVRGPTVMVGYHDRPELTAERRRDGWHHTHDLGRREADGSLSFVGPLTRIIKSAAENIYPAEVEACLRSHPRVREVAVLGVPDPTWGQRVVAVVVPDGQPPQETALIEHCRERIASYKKPSAVVFVEDLPRSSGAVDRDALDAAYGGGGYPGGG